MISENCKNNKIYLAKDEDFKFTKGNWSDGYLVEGRGRGYFQYIGKEKIVKIPHTIQGHKMTSYYKMFEGTSVKEVISRNKNITDMSYMFYKTMSDKLILYNLDTSNVIDMYGMFSNLNVNKLDLSYFDTSKVVNMSFMFKDTKRLNNINLRSFNTKNVVSMWGMFESSNLKQLDVSNFNTCNVTDMCSMFSNSKVVDINFGDNFITSNGTDVMGMFYKCKMKKLDLSRFNLSDAKSVDGIFKKSNVREVLVGSQKDIDRLKEDLNTTNNIVFKIKE